VDQGPVADRQLEALLSRLDRLVEELARMNRRQENRDDLTVIAHELRNLNESLQALAYAALGHSGPQVRRRRSG
jgi:signal transduction histidine kinase